MAPPTNKRTPDAVRRLRDNIISTLTANRNWLDNNATVKTSRAVNVRIKHIEEKYAEFTALTEELLLDDTSENNDASEISVSTENFYLTLLADLESELDRLKPNDDDDRSNNGSEYSSARSQNLVAVNVRLPKRELPKFDGTKPEEWPSFIQRFETALRQPGINDLERFEHLVSCVLKPAADRISNIPLLESNYKFALNKLRLRYENRRLNLRLYLGKLFQLSSVSENDASSLRNIIDTSTSSIRALENLDLKRDGFSNELLVQLIVSKLDRRTRELWETTLSDIPDDDDEKDEVDAFNELMNFLEKRLRVISSVFANTVAKNDAVAKPTRNRAAALVSTTATESSAATAPPGSASKLAQSTCPCCDKAHPLYLCDAFKGLSVKDRYQRVRDAKLCVNCFSNSHWSKACKSIKCKQCARAHHTLLHPTEVNPSSAPIAPPSTTPTTSGTSTATTKTSATSTPTIVSAATQKHARDVLLSTAIVQAASTRSVGDSATEAMVLLDGASHITLITTALARKLRLKLTNSSTMISGIGGLLSAAAATTSLRITAQAGNFSKILHATVVDHVTDPLPTKSFDLPVSWTFTKQFHLANPNFNQSRQVDILIGADYLYDFMLPEIIKQPSAPTLLSSRLGWLVAGPYAASAIESGVRCLATTITRIEFDAIANFLGMEDSKSPKERLSADDEMCETHFQSTYTRDSSGRFVLALPRRPGMTLGESRSRAIDRLKRQRITLEYIEFMQEYERLGHMTRCDPPQAGQEVYYLPHHAVYHNGKIRVVFNASAPTTNGFSLNDILLTGPELQGKVSAIITLWRTHQYAFTGDVVKLFRQLLRVMPDRDLQRIVMLIDHIIMDFQLNTVTYGEVCAPYEAKRSLRQLAADGKERFPAAAAVLVEQTYMDDSMAGADTLQEAKELRDELVELLKTAGMEFSESKWRTNHPDLLLKGTSHDPSPLLENGRALGLEWETNIDNLAFSSLADIKFTGNQLTRRAALSLVSKIFDPLGWLLPLTIGGKLLIQQLWTQKADWDDPISEEFVAKFEAFFTSVALMVEIRVERYLHTGNFHYSDFEIHGFGDASIQAYSACVYLRSNKDVEIRTRLVHAKSRVAPQAQPRTIPQLELCAAVLLVELLQEVTTTLQYPIARCYLYTDSTIVLAYLSRDPGHWKPYVANRVRKILSVTSVSQWCHITGDQNPADLATRDNSFSLFLQEKNLWLHGPEFLQTSNAAPEQQPIDPDIDNLPDARASVHILTARVQEQPWWEKLRSYDSIFARFSRYDRCLRSVAYVFRFCDRFVALHRREALPSGPLTSNELARAEEWLIRVAQAECFAKDLPRLTDGQTLAQKSPLLSINALLHDNIIRVGGRLEKSSLPFHRKHPIVLKAAHRLSVLLVRHTHHQFFHAGNSFVATALRAKYWFIGDISTLIQKCIRECTRCKRFSIRPPEVPIMGNLPSTRVNVSLPFEHVGIDYAGPIFIRDKLRTVRGPVRKTKAYFAIFVCMATKAVHLEACSELTTAAFIATLERFASRRGFPVSITSDNGTNFVGADAELQRNLQALSQDNAVQTFCANHRFTWNFNPPAASHAGGLYEAAVKSVKFHWKRVVGEQLLTFEEVTTLLTQIEAILNSRPLTKFSASTTDAFDVLTPGHFLIGRPPVAVPADYAVPDRLSVSKRWTLLTQLRNSFWRRWSQDYLRTLQRRVKWRDPYVRSLKVDDIVLLRDDQTAPLSWPLARVTKVFPGTDGHVRVVELQTRNKSTLRRPVTKIVRLLEPEGEISTPTTPTAAGC